MDHSPSQMRVAPRGQARSLGGGVRPPLLVRAAVLSQHRSQRLSPTRCPSSPPNVSALALRVGLWPSTAARPLLLCGRRVSLRPAAFPARALRLLACALALAVHCKGIRDALDSSGAQAQRPFGMVCGGTYGHVAAALLWGLHRRKGRRGAHRKEMKARKRMTLVLPPCTE